MPIYSYQCSACGNEFEEREGFDAPSVRDCTCGEKKTARRVFHPVGVIYKGTGFYTTDYARKGGTSGGSTSTSSTSNGSSSTSTSSDSSSSSAPASSSSESSSSKPASSTGD